MAPARPRPGTVVVVGGGLAGLSTCFHLAEKGVDRIILIEKGRIGDGSSSRAGGMNTMLMATETATRARAISFDIFERFSRILDDYEFHQVGCLGLYDPEQFEAASQFHEMHRRAGGRFEVLRRGDLEARFPDLKVAAEEYGVLDLRGGYSEPDRYIPALAAKVREMGVEIREGETIEDFVMEGGEVTGVRTRSAGVVRADAVVCTVNAWANALLSRVGQLLPVRNFVHERFVTEPFERPPRLPATNDDVNSVYFRPTEDDRVLLGTSAIEPGQVNMPGPDFELNELEPTPGSRTYISEAVGERLPMMQGAEFDYQRVGLVSYSIDFQPNIGPVSALPGLFLATNFHSGGFGHHPAAGLFLAEFIVDGQTRIDVARFSPDRFKEFDAEGYLAREITHREMVAAHTARLGLPVRKHH